MTNNNLTVNATSQKVLLAMDPEMRSSHKRSTSRTVYRTTAHDFEIDEKTPLKSVVDLTLPNSFLLACYTPKHQLTSYGDFFRIG